MATSLIEHDLKATIRTIANYPKPGIMFRDITTLLGDARAFRRAVDELVQPWAGAKIDKVAGVEARGFILGGAVAHLVAPAARTRAFAVFYTGTIGCGALAPFAYGLVSDRLGIAATIAVIAAVALLTLPLAAALRGSLRQASEAGI